MRDLKTDFDKNWAAMDRSQKRMTVFTSLWLGFVFSLLFAIAVGFGWAVTHPETIGFYIGRYGDRIVAGVTAARGGK